MIGTGHSTELESEEDDIVPPDKKRAVNKNDESDVELLGTRCPVSGLKNPGSSVSGEEAKPTSFYDAFFVGCENEKEDFLDCLFEEFCIQGCITLYNTLGDNCTD